MNWREMPLFAMAATVCFALLVVCLLLLGLRPSDTDATIVIEKNALASGKPSFPSGFGDLSALVPYYEGAIPTGEAVLPPQATAIGPRSADWLAKQSADDYVVQVMTTRDEASVQRFLEQQKDRQSLSYFPQEAEGERWYVVIYGHYTTSDAARDAAKTLDFGLESKPFPKRLGAYLPIP